MTIARVSIAITLCASYLLAQPSGHEVAHGAAETLALQNLLQITTSDKAIINWKEFSSKAGEIIKFVQPSISSAVLNRVTGENASTLYGDLEANGQVYLVNPNGIVIGQNARIDAGAFVASTFDVLDSDFIEGNALRFFGATKAGVVNLGTIKTGAGDCTLIGFSVENDGSIEASGTASLVASNQVILKPHDLQRIYISSDQDTPYTDNPYLLAFNQKIEKDALHFRKDEDGIFLLLDAPTATTAGAIKAASAMILGDYVQILDNAVIDARDIRIGGDYQGKNETLVNASQTYVSPGAKINAPSGGRVIVWGTEAASFFGAISAKPQGFVEISSHGRLDPQGFVDTGGGTLLLDPVDVTIGVGNVAISYPAPAAPPPPPPALVPDPVAYTFSATPATIDAGNLATFLGFNNVVIATNQAGAGTGNITVNSAVSWGSAFGLTLDVSGTSGTIAINRDIQNSGAGGVTLLGGTGPILIGSLGGAAKVSVGSQNGLTIINAPSASVALQGSNVGLNRPAQLGFYTAAGGTSMGAISVTCGQLSLTGGTVGSGAQIGHGEIDTNVNCATTSAATITVTVQGDISLFTSANAGAASTHAWIGHASESYNTTLAASADQDGAISVVSNAGNITLTTGPGGSNVAAIGHGWRNRIAGGANLPSLAGAISVRAPAGDITFSATAAISGRATIGHGGINLNLTNVSGDIDVVCGGDLTLNLPPNAGISYIGPRWDIAASSCAGNIRVTAGGDLTINAGGSYIGFVYAAGAVPFTTSGDIEVVAGRDIATNAPSQVVFIGKRLSGTSLTANGRAYVAAGRDITLNPASLQSIEAPGDVSVAAARHITAAAGTSFTSIGTSNLQPSGNATSAIYACGNILALNSGTNTAAIGFAQVFGSAANPYNIDVRAGGDLQLAMTLPTTTSGSIYFEADANHAVGSLWGYTGMNLTSIAGRPLPALYPIVDTSLLPAPINATSSACPANNLGALRVDTNPISPSNNIGLTTTSGNITVHSACQRVDGTLQDVGLGTAAPDNLNITTTSGNIEVAGSIPSQGFNNIAINAVAATWTSGTIKAAACNNLDVNDSVVTSGAGSFITLIADVDDSGSGNLTITQNVTTNAGPILLDAGFGAGGGLSAINQTAAQISSTGGSITARAVGNITFNGAATSVTSGVGNIFATSTHGSITANQDVASTTGNITMNAGVDINVLTTGRVNSTAGGNISMTAANNITINGDAMSVSSTTGSINTLAGNNTYVTTNVGTSGSILIITGNDMHLLAPTTSIISTAGPVTLVVDNDFPSRPGIGLGFLSSVAGSIVQSGPGQPLQVFTARQGLNTISGTLNGASFARGTIFNDSATEHWCIYYPDPFFGGVFTVFYKDCQAVIVQEGNKVVSDMLFNLAPENMWEEELMSPLIPPETWRFMLIYDKGVNSLTHFAHERYWLSRRNIHFIKYPYIYKEEKPLAELVPSKAATKATQNRKRRIY